MPPDFSDLCSNYMAVADVPANKRYTLTITNADIVSFTKYGTGPNGPKEEKLVLEFAESGKELACNKPSMKVLANAFGGTTEALRGKKIVIFLGTIQGKAAILVDLPAQPAADALPPRRATVLVDGVGNSAAPALPNNPPPPAAQDFDDEIPFS